MCKLSDIEKSIIKKRHSGHSVGNDVLYKLCEEHHLSKKEQDYIAAQMWLIGRAYAASPERRDYGEKINWKNSGNGLDTYFDLLSEKLCNEYSQTLENIVNSLSGLGKYKLKNESIDKDIKILSTVINSVIEFNKLLKKIRFSVDKDDISTHVNEDNKRITSIENNQKNIISFSSKFLHFHFPNIVFIFDSITKSHFKGYGNPYNFKFKNETSKVKFYKSENKKEKAEDLSVSQVEKMLSLSNFSSQEKEYATHCIREYLLAKAIYKFHSENNLSDDIFADKNIPRVIDTYMLIANS